jgi:hypothetical protein
MLNNCPDCKKQFRTIQGLTLHRVRAHKYRNPKPPPKRHFKKRQVSVPPLHPHTGPPLAVAFCPCCGVNLRALNIALGL